MSFKFLNRTKENTATTGTGNITFGGAVSGGFQAFSAGLSNGDTCPYAIADGNNWEEGVLTYISASNSCSRAVAKSNNSNTAISLSGSAIIFCAIRVEDIGSGANQLLQVDAAGKLPAIDGSQLTNLPSPSLVDSNGIFPVGWSASMITTGSSVSNGGTIAGSSLNLAVTDSSGTAVAAGPTQTGTWKNVSGTSVTASRQGQCVRTA